MLDAEPAFPGPAGLTNQRHTKPHALHVQKAIEVVRTQWPKKPVWLIGTSNGTISTVNAALPAKIVPIPGPIPDSGPEGLPNGIVLTSSTTEPDLISPDGELHFVIEAGSNLKSINVPTLVVWHKEDICPFSRKDKASEVFKGLVSVPKGKKEELVVSHGTPNVAVSPCSAFGFHGFNGSENTVVTGIAKFIKMHSPKK